MSSRYERAKEQQPYKKVKNRIVITIIAALIIIGGEVVFHQLNKQNKIDTQESASPVQKHTVANNNNEKSRSSSSSIESNDSEMNNEITSVQNSVADESQEVNAYGHLVEENQQDNTDIAESDRQRNEDLENLDYIVTAPLTYEQKMIQMKAWGFSFTPAPPSENLVIWGRDVMPSTGSIGIVYPDGSVEKAN